MSFSPSSTPTVRKKMYFGVVIPVIGGTALMEEADIQPWVDTAIEIYDRTSNIDLRFTGFCRTTVEPPGGEIVVDCGAGGFFADCLANVRLRVDRIAG